MPSKSRNVVAVSGLTKGVLIILGAGAVIGAALVFPGIGILYKAFKKEQWEKARRRGILRATIKRLERQKLVSWAEKNNETRLILTDKGKKKVLQYNIDGLKVNDTKKWDGLWRVVVFDIPEGKRLVRNQFREKLKQMGLVPLQRSVFICRFSCKDEIDFLTHAFEIHPFVHYIVAKEVSYIK